MEDTSDDRKQVAEELWAQGVVEYFVGKGKGDQAAGYETMKASLTLDPHHADRHYFIGCMSFMFRRSREEAIQHYEQAIAIDPKCPHSYQELVQIHEGTGDFEKSRDVARRAIEAGARWSNEWQYPPAWTPGLAARPWWDASEFEWVPHLEKAWETIRSEAIQLRGGSPDEGADSRAAMPSAWPAVGDQESATHDANIVSAGGEWRELLLFGATVSREVTAQRCPVTAALLEEHLPGAVAMATIGVGEILFSALAPGTRLTPHCASSNVRLTCHLGLTCPEGARIRVGQDWKTWQEGKCLFFDDSFTHEVENNSDRVRIVLLIRFWHPELAIEQWMPTLEKGVEDYEALNKRRQMPPMTELAGAKLKEAMAAAA